MYMGMDAAGTMKYRSRLKTAYADPSSLETVTSALNLASSIEQRKANNIIVRGSLIIKETIEREVWNAAATGDFDTDEGGYLLDDVANLAAWPPSTEFGEYWAQYGRGGVTGNLFFPEIID